MKMKYLQIFFAILIWCAPIFAQQDITFDDQGWTPDQSLGSSFTIKNIVFSSAKNFYTNYGYNFDIYNTSIYFVFQNPSTDQFIINNVENRSFDLTSMAAYQVSENINDTLIIEGWEGTSKKYNATYSNIDDWQILTLNYRKINKVVIKIRHSGSTALSDYNFDNFSFNNLELPVELVDFNATAEQNYIKLEWNTATELNNYGFDVEREDENVWVKIGFVGGNGTSNSPKYYSFIDTTVEDGNKYNYRLKQIDIDGAYKYYYTKNEVEIANTLSDHNLFQNYPNPFNASTIINYQVAKEGQVSLKVYDILGNEVCVLVNEKKSAGDYSVSFNANDMASGIYIYSFITNGFSVSKKMILVK